MDGGFEAPRRSSLTGPAALHRKGAEQQEHGSQRSGQSSTNQPAESPLHFVANRDHFIPDNDIQI